MDLTMPYEKRREMKSEGVPTARLYLLNTDFLTISAATGEENAQIGASFFELFPANRLLREELSAYVASYPSDVLLTLCGRAPVVFAGALAAQAGLVLAAVPEGEIKRTLGAPAAFHRVPACVRVGTTAQMKYRAHDEADFSRAAQWLLSLSTSLSCRAEAQILTRDRLLGCVTRLSALLDVPLSCDFSGVLDTSLAELNEGFAVGVVLAALMLARRVSPGAGVRLCAVSESAPTLYLEICCESADDPFPELLPLFDRARARGAVLDAVRPKGNPHLLQLRACIGTVELSAEGLRERARFLEGFSPLGAMPTPHAIPAVFSEISFD